MGPAHLTLKRKSFAKYVQIDEAKVFEKIVACSEIFQKDTRVQQEQISKGLKSS